MLAEDPHQYASWVAISLTTTGGLYITAIREEGRLPALTGFPSTEALIRVFAAVEPVDGLSVGASDEGGEPISDAGVTASTVDSECAYAAFSGWTRLG